MTDDTKKTQPLTRGEGMPKPCGMFSYSRKRGDGAIYHHNSFDRKGTAKLLHRNIGGGPFQCEFAYNEREIQKLLARMPAFVPMPPCTTDAIASVILPDGMPYIADEPCLLLLRDGGVVDGMWVDHSVSHGPDGEEHDGFYFYSSALDDGIEFDQPIGWCPMPGGSKPIVDAAEAQRIAERDAMEAKLKEEMYEERALGA